MDIPISCEYRIAGDSSQFSGIQADLLHFATQDLMSGCGSLLGRVDQPYSHAPAFVHLRRDLPCCAILTAAVAARPIDAFAALSKLRPSSYDAVHKCMPLRFTPSRIEPLMFSESNSLQLRAEFFTIGCILLFSFLLNSWNNDFPLGYHGDEPKKARFILDGTQDYHHPILILQLSRIGNAILGFEEESGAVLIGRFVSALAGTAIVWFTYLLALRCLPGRWSLLAALLTATSPILVIHAHYLKEDILFTACALASVLAWLRFWQNVPMLPSICLAGLAMGLSMSAHYKSVLLWPLALAIPFFDGSSLRAILTRLPALAGIFFLSEFVFFSVNYPILIDPDIFLSGLNHEYTHAAFGHSLHISALDYYFLFHLRFSLIPGLTLPIVVLAIVGLLWILGSWKTVSVTARILVTYAVVYYVVPELVPSKPAPDFARYVLQVAPALIVLAVIGMERLAVTMVPHIFKPAYLVLIGVCVAWPAFLSVALDHHLASDTRQVAQEWINERDEKAIYEHYAHESWDCVSLADLDLAQVRSSGVRYLVASDFRYERYFRGVKMEGQSDLVHDRHRAYEHLFQGTVQIIRPAFRSYAFSNPTIRIIDLDKLPPLAISQRGE
ncbi:ArnT family glycosyltransferase [Rubinisphaera margarita]|uniref:ArnT family glycosyltransferase n=1 Tax=Rubinisphaera margarita TaxID=2909586 RepID=UPI001EE8743A|nr:glycosyltransferase family 39 protein [Rubinisphaera margarita]MCG6157240.1 glycosyltransferase family 39 protein [Rubinisphaera margarita]